MSKRLLLLLLAVILGIGLFAAACGSTAATTTTTGAATTETTAANTTTTAGGETTTTGAASGEPIKFGFDEGWQGLYLPEIRLFIAPHGAKDLAIEEGTVGLLGSPTRVVKIFRPSLARHCEKITPTDEQAIGEAADRLLVFLREKLLI